MTSRKTPCPQCGQPKKARSARCRACYQADRPRVGDERRYDKCACGDRKQKASHMCASCYSRLRVARNWKVCRQCGKSLTQAQYKRPGQQFCSRACGVEWRKVIDISGESEKPRDWARRVWAEMTPRDRRLVAMALADLDVRSVRKAA